MSSYLDQHAGCHPPQHTFSKQRSLEIQNKQLQEQLKDKQDSLNLQTKILRTQSHNNINDSCLACVEQLLHKQHQIRSYFTQKLIQKQLQIEQAKQMSEIINNYEKRIADLRSVLINKEGEISSASYQFQRGTVTRRQNLQAVNSETLEKMALAKYAKQRKKLQVEIQALEFTLNQMQKSKQSKKKRSDSRSKEQTPKKQLVCNKKIDSRQQRADMQYFTAFSWTGQQDLMTDKVIKLIQQETQKYNQQTELAEQLKLQLEFIEAQTNLNVQKYKKAEQQWSKVLLNTHQPSPSQNKIQNQLSFIKELEQEMSNANSELIGSELFSNRDTNKPQNQSDLSKSNKSTATTLKQRRHRNLKEN